MKLKVITYLISIGFVLALLANTTTAQSTFFGVDGGFVNLSGGDAASFTLQPTFGGSFTQRLGDSWQAGFSFSMQTLYDDTAASSSLTLSHDKNNALRKWKAMRFGLTVDRFLLPSENNFNITCGIGGGLMAWKISDPQGDTVFLVTSQKNQTVDYSASEVFLTLQSAFNFELTSRITLALQSHADYLTGAGAEFNDAIESARDKWQMGSFLSLRYGLGGPKNMTWQPIRPIASTSSSPIPTTSDFTSSKKLDSDNDGIPDDKDKCPYNEAGVAVDKDGCPLDSDYDGVPDGLDHCPNTDRAAAGSVDIYGCAVDSDFDGIPDYRDKCPNNQVGAAIDSIGCPIDSDKDGVPDGLDDCPNTLYGVEVDVHGCINLAIIEKPLILNIDYTPGSYEVDSDTRDRLKKLAAILNFVSDVKIEINGYSDDIGTNLANRNLSEKRARRVSQYLISYGVDSSRIKVFGKGESNFVADNSTAEGRAKNRRIEIVFYK